MSARRLAETFVGARSRAMLSLVPAFGAKSFQSKSFQSKSFQSKSFRAPSAPELLSLCVAKEKVTKEKGHPASALSGHRATAPCVASTRASMPSPARKVRVRAPGFVDRASCPDAKLAGIHAGHPAGFSFARPPLQRGPRVERRASCAHSSEEPHQEQSNSFGLLLHHRVRATMARCSTGVPCAAVSRGRQAAQRALPRMATPFRAGRSPLEKPGPDSRTCRPWMGGKRQAGGRFLLVTSLLDKQKRSNSAAAGRRKLLL